MLNRQKVILAFEEKRDQFHQYVADQDRQHELVRKLLDDFTRLDHASDAGRRWPSAASTGRAPCPPTNWTAPTVCVCPFPHQWQTHEEARAWALDVLRDRPVAAVDGSQITPTKDFSTPVGAVQVGWFLNYHAEGGRYVKDVEFEVLGPDELDTGDDDSELAGGGYPNWLVNQKRFVGECLRLCRIMERACAPARDATAASAFWTVRWWSASPARCARAAAMPMSMPCRNCSIARSRHRVPLVAYVDTSFSRDLVTLMETLASTGAANALSDAGLLSRNLPSWGDRSPCFLCARRDELSKDGRASFYKDIAFTYLRVVEGRSPARVEMPRWLLESGQVET